MYYHIFSCFIMLCDILSYIVIYYQLYIINGLIQHQNDRQPWVFAISVLHQMHLEPSMAMKQTLAKLMELRYLGDS